MKFILSFILIVLFMSCQNNSRNRTVFIKALNEADSIELNIVKSTLENNFNFDCKFLKDTSFFVKDTLCCDKFQSSIGNIPLFTYDEEKPTIVYVTRLPLTSVNASVLGVTYGNQIFIRLAGHNQIKSTVAHEVLHNFGLDHCHNNCIMNVDDSVAQKRLDSDFWDYFSDKPIVCDFCKSKLP